VHTGLSRIEFPRRISRDGRGGAGLPPGAIRGDSGVGADWLGGTAGAGASSRNDDGRRRSSMGTATGCPFLSWPGMPMRICASRVESWFGLSRRVARCVASRAAGDGGRGAGFIVCATCSGIVGMFTDEITGSTPRQQSYSNAPVHVLW
jgi:hypothetical protein